MADSSAADKAVWRERFDQTAQDPWSWLFAARNLRRSATLLHDRVAADWDKIGGGTPIEELNGYQLIGSCLLVAGLALENLIKGVRVRHEPSIVADGRIQSWG